MMESLSKLAHIPGNLLKSIANVPIGLLGDIADLLPSSGSQSHSDFDSYCTAKGGTVSVGQDGKKTCNLNIGVSQDHHAQYFAQEGQTFDQRLTADERMGAMMKDPSNSQFLENYVNSTTGKSWGQS